jgi:predicted SprT family Zn-dependent metalloprotease
MCFFLKNKIRAFFANKKMNRYEKHLHDCDDKLKLNEILIKKRNEKRLQEIIEFETNRLYVYPEFIR